MVAYVVLAYFFRWQRGFQTPNDKFYLTVVFDSGVFAGSAAVLVGIYLEDVLKLLGNMTAFLAIASMVGLLYSLHALLDKNK
jgi:hypothetical protein